MAGALRLELYHINGLRSINMILGNVLVGIISQDCILRSWFQFRGCYSVLELLGRLSKGNVWLTVFFQGYPHRQKLFFDINDSLDCDSVVDISRNGKVKIFSIALHATSVPYLAERGLRILFVKKICIYEDIIITIDIHILRIDSNSKVNVIVFITITLWFIACYDDWISTLDVCFYPLKEFFVLRLGLVVVPGFVNIGKFADSLLCVFTNEDF